MPGTIRLCKTTRGGSLRRNDEPRRARAFIKLRIYARTSRADHVRALARVQRIQDKTGHIFPTRSGLLTHEGKLSLLICLTQKRVSNG